jgi:hypothetical protein
VDAHHLLQYRWLKWTSLRALAKRMPGAAIEAVNVMRLEPRRIWRGS